MVTIQSAPRANTLSSWVTKKKEQNAPKLYKAQCGFCCYSETRPSLSPTHICKIINRCLKSLHRPAYHKHSLCLIILFHFLSHRVWLCSFAFPQFHLHRSRADALTPQTHANAPREQHRTSTNSHMLSTLIAVWQNHYHKKHILLSCIVSFAETAYVFLWDLIPAIHTVLPLFIFIQTFFLLGAVSIPSLHSYTVTLGKLGWS